MALFLFMLLAIAFAIAIQLFFITVVVAVTIWRTRLCVFFTVFLEKYGCREDCCVPIKKSRHIVNTSMVRVRCSNKDQQNENTCKRQTKEHRRLDAYTHTWGYIRTHSNTRDDDEEREKKSFSSDRVNINSPCMACIP